MDSGRKEMSKIPRATYRVQLHSGFPFQKAAGIADYLAALGISHLYASPYLQASLGSLHGYDVKEIRLTIEHPEYVANIEKLKASK